MQLTALGVALSTLDGHQQSYPPQAGASTGAGTNSNGDSGIYLNSDPDGRQALPAHTVFVSCTTYGSASLQVYLAPSQSVPGQADTWFAEGAPFTANGTLLISKRFAKLKVTTTGALAGCTGPNVWVQ